jgi:hypothetical protein
MIGKTVLCNAVAGGGLLHLQCRVVHRIEF